MDFIAVILPSAVRPCLTVFLLGVLLLLPDVVLAGTETEAETETGAPAASGQPAVVVDVPATADGPAGEDGPTGPEVVVQQPSPSPAPSPSPVPAPVPVLPQSMEDLAAYLASVRTHVETDPALAAAYLVFWSELKSVAVGDVVASEQGERQGKAPGKAPGKASVEGHAEGAERPPGGRFEAIASVAATVSREVGRQVGKTDSRFLVAEVVKRTLSELSGNVAADKALGAGNGGKPAGNRGQTDETPAGPTAAQRLLANLDALTRPGISSAGRYRFAGTLRAAASIGSSAEVWNLCKALPACVQAHDELFAPAMAGLSLLADSKRRVEGDAGLASSGLWQHMQPIAAGMDAQLGSLPTFEARNAALSQAASTQWQTALQALPVATGVRPPASDQPAPDRNRLDALFTLGLAGAELAGSDKLAHAFAVTRQPALEFVSLASQGIAGPSLLTSMAGVALVVAGVQAIALLDGDDAAARVASAQMRELVTTLDARTYGALRDAAAEQLLAINVVDTRVAALGLALDVVKTDVARLETAGRRRIASNWQSETARRWSAFDADNDRCFSLRRRQDETGLLSAADFRWCEERFLQGATLKARYANKSPEYAMDPRFSEAADRTWPFHAHYPLLLTAAGMDQRTVMSLPDPLEWQQYAAALLRLYREHPPGAGDGRRRAETLATLAAAGGRLAEALRALVIEPGGTAGDSFRTALHAQALDDYLVALSRLAGRVVEFDDPSAHPFGKRMTMDLRQAAPASGPKRSAAEASLRRSVLRSSGLQTCGDAPPDAFLVSPDRLSVESRRFFGSPIAADEVRAAWNREVVNRLALEVDSLVEAVPPVWLWAHLQELGSIRACIARFRPESLTFTREDGPEDGTFKAAVIVGADLEVRFHPGTRAARTLGVERGGSLLLAQQSGGRACTFGYRNDDKGCSRGQCLADIAATLWGVDRKLAASHVRCNEEPLRGQLAKAPQDAPAGLDTKAEAIAALYWSTQSPRIREIESDALRSDEFLDASAAWLQYYALAGVTLGPWPEPAELLADLFAADSNLAPRAVVRTMLQERVSGERLLKSLRQQVDEVRALVAQRGQDLVSSGAFTQLPHLAELQDTLDRIELVRVAHAPAGS